MDSGGTTDDFWVESCRGACVDILAPAAGVKGAEYSYPSAYYSTGSGTSYAAPIVAGIAARYLQSYPTASPTAVWNHIQMNGSINKIPNVPAGTINRFIYQYSAGICRGASL